jgi:hypothetical protein
VKIRRRAQIRVAALDDRWIYHEVDRALDGDSTGRLDRFSDGRWLPRRLSGPWTLDLRNNRATILGQSRVRGAHGRQRAPTDARRRRSPRHLQRQRGLHVDDNQNATPASLVVVEHWFEELNSV